jgi:Outer membrane protein beta-barrel domain
MPSFRSISVALLVTTLTAAPAYAQSGSSAGRPHTRDGFWFSGGLGVGSLGCQDCDQRETSVSADLSLGGTLDERLLIGGGISGWSKEVDGLTLTVSSLEARVRFYPNGPSGFFLAGGLGLGSIRTAFSGFDDTQTGVGLTLGVGWDLRVGNNVSLTPYWTGTAVSAGDQDANFGQLGLAVTIH